MYSFLSRAGADDKSRWGAFRDGIRTGESAVTPFAVLAQAVAIVLPVLAIVLGLTELAYYLS